MVGLRNLVRRAQLLLCETECLRCSGKTIISEYFLNIDERTLKVDSKFGGIAGGSKFVGRVFLICLVSACVLPLLRALPAFNICSERHPL